MIPKILLLVLWLTMITTTSSALSIRDNNVGIRSSPLFRSDSSVAIATAIARGGDLSSKLSPRRGFHNQKKPQQLSMAATLSPEMPSNSSFFNNRRGGGTNQVVEKQDDDNKGQQQQQSFLARHAFACACVITTINAVTADLLTQLVFESGPWNPQRSLVFAAFGFIYQGMAQYFIVNKGWESLFPGNTKRAITAKICGMNLISDPLLFMPCFYIFKEVLASGSIGLATIKAALMAYKTNCIIDWRNSWMVWFPGHAVTYGVMPKHKRIPWMAFLSFFYMCILSITRG